MSSIVKAVKTEVKVAMRARDKNRLTVLRTMLSEVKRIEVDERIELDDQRVLAILDKMQKQRRDSLTQYEEAGRDELAAIEKNELEVISTFLPAALTEEELTELIQQTISQVDATSMADMGKVMAYLKPKLQGRADMSAVSGKIKEKLN